jgi:predicted SnoaL-like aldol condensation-catalyzing enzyme
MRLKTALIAGAAAVLTPLAAAAQAQDCDAPLPSALPVVGTSDLDEQLAMLESDDPQEAANKRLVFEMWRVFLVAHHIDRAGEFLPEDYIQHNPMAETGLQGVKDFFTAFGFEPTEVPPNIPSGVIDIVADGDKVVLLFPRTYTDSCGREYTTMWADMFRIEDGVIVEHWDTQLRP